MNEITIEEAAVITGGNVVEDTGRSHGQAVREYYEDCVRVCTDYFEYFLG